MELPKSETLRGCRHCRQVFGRAWQAAEKLMPAQRELKRGARAAIVPARETEDRVRLVTGVRGLRRNSRAIVEHPIGKTRKPAATKIQAVEPH